MESVAIGVFFAFVLLGWDAGKPKVSHVEVEEGNEDIKDIHVKTSLDSFLQQTGVKYKCLPSLTDKEKLEHVKSYDDIPRDLPPGRGRVWPHLLISDPIM